MSRHTLSGFDRTWNLSRLCKKNKKIDLTLGRLDGSHINLNIRDNTLCESVSSSHAIIHFVPKGDAYIYNCSRRGTFKGGERIPSRSYQLLRNGDTLYFGDLGPFRYSCR